MLQIEVRDIRSPEDISDDHYFIISLSSLSYLKFAHFSNMSTIIPETPSSHPMIQEESAISDDDILKHLVLKTFGFKEESLSAIKDWLLYKNMETFLNLYSSTTMSQPGLNLMGSTEYLVEILNLPKTLFQNSSY